MRPSLDIRYRRVPPRAAPLAPPFPIVANYPTAADLHPLLGTRVWTPTTELVLLDAREPQGFLRQWQAPGFGPERHIAYAVQWFGLALALTVIYIWMNLHA